MPMPKLEVFDVDAPQKQTSGMVVTQLGAIEEAKLAAYEQGYKAGWDDAAAAQSEDQTRIRADLARNLQQLSFTYQEARAHILKAVEPLLEEMVNRRLPDTARETLAPLVLERMGRDPAVSSSVFVTFATDFTGFFVFLGLASVILL